MAIERYGSKTDVAVKLVLVFFVCLLSFSVGTFVGKKFSDRQNELAKFEPNAKEQERAVASVHAEHGSEAAGEHGQKSETLTDEEIAKLAEEFVSDEEGSKAHAAPATGHGEVQKTVTDKNEAHGAPAHGTAKAATPAKADSHAVDTHAVAAHKPANSAEVTEAQAKNIDRKIANTVTGKAEEAHGAGIAGEAKRPVLTGTTPAAKPAASQISKDIAASEKGKFTVQVGSYQTEAEADKVVQAMTAQGFSAFFLKADVKGKTWYRVNLGVFATSDKADAYKTDLMSRSKVSSAIVQVIK